MAEKVNADNFVRAETDMYFTTFVADGAGGQFFHRRRPPDIDHQTVVRMNRDTLYSSIVLDLDAGPATFTLPDGNGRYIALQAIDQDHYVVHVAYDAGNYTFTKEQVGTRYMAALVRIEVDAHDLADIAKVNALQDQLAVSQPGTGTFTFGDWDKESRDETRKLLLGLFNTLPNLRGCFGKKDEVEPIHHLLGTAGGWGGNPDNDAVYYTRLVDNNDGKTAYVLTIPANVPVDGFWSISVYNASGFFEKNDQGLYSLNNLTAKKAGDGTVTIHFGGDAAAENYLPIPQGWNYTVRLYRPQPAVLSGAWNFPEPELAK